jgi:predicted PurR-regulated permease PerM
LDTRAIALKTLIQASMFGLVILFVLLLRNAYEVFLLVFAGILFCILLRSMTDWISGKVKTPDGVSLALAIIIPLLLIAVVTWMMAPEVAKQANQLADRLPQAIQELRKQLMQYAWAEQLWQHKERLSSLISSGSSGANLISRFFTTSFGLLGNLIIIIFLGLFLAATPEWYVRGTVRLFPVHRREHVHGILRTTGLTLRNWLIAKLATMTLIGVLTGLGLWMLGIDLALVLGVIAGLLAFIPNFGPIISAIPAVLVGLIHSPQKALYIVLLYIAIQTVESYLVDPLIQKHMIRMPPALLLTSQVLFGILAGLLGLILAVPLTAAAMVMVKVGYIESALEKGTKPAATTN